MNPISVLMIGGTGTISADCTLLALQTPGVSVTLLNRGRTPSFLPEGVDVIHGDANDVEDMRQKLQGRSFDVVCDFICYDVGALDRHLDLFEGRCNQYVFISSCAAYRDNPGVLLRTEANCQIGRTNWDYGLNKSICELRLRERCAKSGMHFTIVRPSYTCDHFRFFSPWTIPHSQSWTIADRLLKGKPLVMEGDGRALCTVTQTSDFAKAFVGLFGNPKAMDEDFHITSDEYITWRRVAEIQAEILGVELKVCCVPPEELCLELGYGPGQKVMNTISHELYDSSKIRAAVPAFRCTKTCRQGLEESVCFYREHPEFQQINPWWSERFDAICANYDR